MKSFRLLTIPLLLFFGCEETKITTTKKLLLKEITDISDNSKIDFTYNPDSTILKIVKTTYHAIITWNMKYELNMLSKIATTVKNSGNLLSTIVETNDTIYFHYDSENLLKDIKIRSVDNDELIMEIEYQYEADHSIKQLKYFNYQHGSTETIDLSFTNHNLTSLNNLPIVYDQGNNPIFELGLQFKWGGDFDFGAYFSSNNVIQNDNWEFLIDYNEFNYPTRLQAVSDKTVWSDKIFTYY